MISRTGRARAAPAGAGTRSAVLQQARERRRFRRPAVSRRQRTDPGLSRPVETGASRPRGDEGGRWRWATAGAGPQRAEGTGVSPYAINSRAGLRISTNDGYLEPARGRPNLTIVGNAMVSIALLRRQSAACQRRDRSRRRRAIACGRGARCCCAPARSIRRRCCSARASARGRGWNRWHQGGGRPAGGAAPARPSDPAHPARPARRPSEHVGPPPHQLLHPLQLGARRLRRERHDRDRRQPGPPRMAAPRAPASRLGLPGFQRGQVRITTTRSRHRPAGRRAHAVRRPRPGAHARRRAAPARDRAADGDRAISTRVEYGSTGRSIDDELGARSSTTGFSPNAPTPSMPAAPAAWARDDPRSVVDPDCRVIGCPGLRVIDASVMPDRGARQHALHDGHDRREDGGSAQAFETLGARSSRARYGMAARR